MCIAAGYKHDIFLSYAHRDDEPIPGNEDRPGWVSLFYKTLNYQILQQLPPGSDYSPWKDDDLGLARPLSGQLLDTVSQSAILLVMMSPHYMRSEWCKTERMTFLQSAGRTADAPIIVVEKTPVADESLPEVFRDRLRLPFWNGSREEPRTLGSPLPNVAIPEHAFYYSKIDALSREIAKLLQAMKGAKPDLRPRPEPEPKFRLGPVFLAQVTDDLEEERDGIRAFLEGERIPVRPDTGVYYPPDPTTFSEAALRDLADAGLFVQLLSDTRGRRPAGLPQGYAALQWELATERLGRPIPILQWRSPTLDIAAISDPHLSALMQQETVRAESLVDFQRAILARLAAPPPQKPALPATNILVFVNVDPADRHLAEQVEDILARNGAEVSLPAAGSDCAGNREDLETNLRACDGLIVIYGATSDLWVRRQLLEFRKQRAFRDSPLLALSIFEGPPPVDRPPVGISLNELEVQDCRAGTDNPAVLEQEVLRFLERVRARQQAREG